MLLFCFLSLMVTAKAELLSGSCSFQDSICDYMFDFDPAFLSWTLKSSGQYMYVDSKSFQEVARLASPMTTVPMSGCLSFQYQQYHAGDHLFTLFSRDQTGQYQELWRADLPENNNVNWCPETRVWSSISYRASSVSVLSHCDFEAGLCGFTKEGDSGDWMLARGPTPTSYTGPRGDHTTGVGHYLHIEASVILAGHKARLLSSSLRGSRETQCLQFYYHMYGSGIGQLSVYLQTGQGNQDKLLWTSHGEQGISWLRASVNYQCDQQHQGIQDVGDFVSSVEHKRKFLTQTVAVCQSYNGGGWKSWL